MRVTNGGIIMMNAFFGTLSVWLHQIGLSAQAPNEDTFLKFVEGLDFASLQSSISGFMRALGLGSEADKLATILIVAFIVFAMIGYAAGAKNTNSIAEKDKTNAGVDVPKESKDKT
jgi:hypothetical protein